jgi:hypothetical protein
MVAYSFKKQFIAPILSGVFGVAAGLPLPPGENYFPKRQTIRAIGKRRHARPGEMIQLYTAMRTKQCRKLGEARCVSVQTVKLFIGPASIGVEAAVCGPHATVEGRPGLDWRNAACVKASARCSAGSEKADDVFC